MLEVEQYIEKYGLEKFLLVKQIFIELMKKANKNNN